MHMHIYRLVISAQLPFQTLTSTKSSPNSTNSVPNKKRKVTSPLVGSKTSKIFKVAKNDCCDQDIVEETTNAKEKNDSEDCVVIMDNVNKDFFEQNDRQDDENKEVKGTSKRNSLGRNKKLDKSQQKSGALTKFLKKNIHGQTENTANDDARESKARQNLQNTFIEVEKNEEECLDESSELQPSEKSKSQAFQMNEKLDDSRVSDQDTKGSVFQQSHSNIIFLSSDDESSNELDKSTSSRNEEIRTSTTPVTPKTDKKKQLKRLSTKQLEKRQEIARKREEKLKLRMVCYAKKFQIFTFF